MIELGLRVQQRHHAEGRGQSDQNANEQTSK